MAAPLLATVAKAVAKRVAKKTAAKAANKIVGSHRSGGSGKILISIGVFGVVGSLFLISAVVMALIGGFGGATGGTAAALACMAPQATTSTVTVSDIPQVAYDAYQKAGQTTGVDWSYIAGIGKVESDHGRTGGRHLDEAGDVQISPIYGPVVLVGGNHVRAEGPMQFLPSTWNGGAGKDGNFDGTKNPQNIFDAALATGYYLKNGGAPGNIRAAIFGYNHSNAYVTEVLGWADKYHQAAATANVGAVITGPITGPITGNVSVAQANIPTRSGDAAFRSTLHTMLNREPDLVTLNEQGSRSLDLIESAAPGYAAYRDTSPVPPGEENQAHDTVVLWKSSTYNLLSSGRVQIVNDDHTRYDGHPVVWDRYATWALVERKDDGAVLSIVSVHHMTNPAKYGPDLPKRQEQYGQGMDILLGLIQALGSHGPVFVGGDFNVHPDQTQSWTAPTKMNANGFDAYNNAVDYIFYQHNLGITLGFATSGPTPEPDHRWIFARFNMNGASTSAGTGTTTGTTGTASSGASASGGWVLPEKPGTYTLTARWGDSGGHWSSGYHTGLDFAGPIGNKIFAAADGVVERRPDQASWAGPNFLIIHHGKLGGKTIDTWYAHMQSLAPGITTGTHVSAGQWIANEGAEGNVTGPHLHFEVRVDGKDVDPEIWLKTAGTPDASGLGGCGATDYTGSGFGPWGGFSNGEIPLDQMCKLTFSETYLRCDAAAAIEELNRAYVAKFGRSLAPVGGYRSFADQEICANDPAKHGLCATPGTSNHGWGLAADLSNGHFQTYGTPDYNWMMANAPDYGYVLPDWARPGGSKHEPWHWEFNSAG